MELVTAPTIADATPSRAGVPDRTEYLTWLVRLRWMALGGVLVAALVAPWLGIDGINLPVLLAAVASGAAYNGVFHWVLATRPRRAGSPLLHALADFGALTLVLWATGGIDNPFVSMYTLHVLLVTIVSGKRAALVACVAALGSVSFLIAAGAWPALQISSFQPAAGLGPMVEAGAFGLTVVSAAYLVHRSASEIASRTEEAAAARRASRQDAEILLRAMDRLDVGVEVLGPDGTPRFRNRHLLERRGLSTDCPRDSYACEPADGLCPVDEARQGRQGSCRFSQRDRSGRERVIELLSFPLGDERPAPVLRLHLDRSENVIAERKLLFAERLASLGRAAGVLAHELNTPLATIQTLAADMRTAIEAGGTSDLARDLDDSARIIHDETRRCRAITQDLLAGRDLLAGGSTAGPGDVFAALQRAATLVFGSGGSRARLEVEPGVRGRSVALGHDSLVQVFVNLLQNAADAIEGKPGAKIRVGIDPAGASQLALFVDDDGPGLSPGTADRVLEPFFTTKPPGKGTGLGLYTVASLVREVGGTISLGDRAGGGARARLVLPEATA